MPDDRPNVLWVCTDQQRFDTLGCYGNEHVDTPNLDRLAERGTRFERAYCQNPVCTPSRSSFLTGRYPRTTGVRQNGQFLPDRETLVTRRLAETGYTCGLAGKLHVSPENLHEGERGVTEPERRPDDGYAVFDWSPSPRADRPDHAYRNWLRSEGVELDPDPFEGSPYVETSVAPEYHQTTWCADRAIEFVETNAGFDSPWLFSMNPFDPHSAFDPPRAYLERYLDDLDDLPTPNYDPGELDDKPPFQRRQRRGEFGFDTREMDADDHRLVRAAYYAMVDLIDDQVGRVLDALDRTGQREDTLVVFQSDHGELLGDHGMYLKGPYFYEPSVRVPLIVEGPGVEPRDTDALVELLDLAPTLLEAAGEPVPEAMQGESLWPLLRGEADEGRDAVYCEFYNSQPNFQDPKAYATMARTDDAKVVSFHGEGEYGRGELYDLTADPGETDNLWDEAPALRAEALDALAGRMAGTADPLPERRGKW